MLGPVSIDGTILLPRITHIEGRGTRLIQRKPWPKSPASKVSSAGSPSLLYARNSYFCLGRMNLKKRKYPPTADGIPGDIRIPIGTEPKITKLRWLTNRREGWTPKRSATINGSKQRFCQ